MSTLSGFFNLLSDPAWIMQNGGLYLVVLIVFAETGLLAGFFLPGDSLLFVTGMIIAGSVTGEHNAYPELIYWILLISLAGIAGNYAGYWFGKRSGAMLLNRRDNRIYKKKYITGAKEFYERKGGKAIVLARFLPVIRTFAPIVAGMVGMKMREFTKYNIAGSLCWTTSLITTGFVLGANSYVKENLDIIILCIIAITTLPVALKLLLGKRASNKHENKLIN